MKEGWEKKPLLSFAEVCTGKHDANYATLNGKYRFYTCAYEYMWCDNYRFDEECLILPGNGANVGEVFYYNGPFDAYQRTYVVYKIRDILPKCLYYHFLYNWKTVGVSAQYGAATNYIKIGNFIDYKVNIPPLYEQSRIVEELDQLSNIIEKKRQQLSELDNLAQSIFYDMFGDPVTNEKGWETREFSKCYKLSSGDGLSAKNIIEGDFPVYGGNGIVGYHSDYNMDGEYIIIGRVGALCGNVRNVMGKAFITDNAFILTKNVENVNVYLLYLLKIHNLRQYAREAMQPVISNASLRNIRIILPPLSLQQLFAQKIEAIEKEKELIKQSIKETEELFNSRMDYYFG